jgi:hypothetical protein
MLRSAGGQVNYDGHYITTSINQELKQILVEQYHRASADGASTSTLTEPASLEGNKRADRLSAISPFRVVSMLIDALKRHGQIQLLLRVSLSVIVHFVVPAGNCSEAVPLNTASSSVACTLRSARLGWNVSELPFLITWALPVNIAPPQQKR